MRKRKHQVRLAFRWRGGSAWSKVCQSTVYEVRIIFELKRCRAALVRYVPSCSIPNLHRARALRAPSPTSHCRRTESRTSSQTFDTVACETGVLAHRTDIEIRQVRTVRSCPCRTLRAMRPYLPAKTRTTRQHRSGWTHNEAVNSPPARQPTCHEPTAPCWRQRRLCIPLHRQLARRPPLAARRGARSACNESSRAGIAIHDPCMRGNARKA